MRKRLLSIVVSVMMMIGVCSGLLTACVETEPDPDQGPKKVYFETQKTFNLDLTMDTAIGALGTLCNPGTLTFTADGKAKMDVTFTESAKIMMETMLGRLIPDFVHEDTYELNADKTVITYNPTRESFGGEAMTINIEFLSDNSMKFVFDIGKVIPDTVLYFYSNTAMMPAPETPDEPIDPVVPEVIKVSFDADGAVLNAGFTLPEIAEYEEGDEITLPEANFTKDKHVFRGWAANGKQFEIGGKYLYQPGEKYIIDSSVEFSAVWSDLLTVSFSGGPDAKTSSAFFGTQTTEVAYGKYLYFPENPYTYDAYDKGFAYWTDGETTNKDGSLKAYYPKDSYKVTKDVAFTPVWNEFVTVSFKADLAGGTDYKEMFVIRTPKDSKIMTPDAAYVHATDATKGFAGWKKLDATSICKPSYTMLKIEADTTYIAVINTLVNITFEADGGEGDLPAPIKIGTGLYFVYPACNLTKEGYTFNGWKKSTASATTNGSTPGNRTNVSADTAYKPDWKANRTVSFNLGEGVDGAIEAITQGEGLKITLPEMEATNGDKLFDGWTDGAKIYAAGASYTVPKGADTTLNAVWRDKVTVTFTGGEGATGTVANMSSYQSKSFELPANAFSMTGKDFVGWTDGENSYMPGDTYTVSDTAASTLTFTAVWFSGTPYAADYDATFRAAQTTQFVYTNAKDEAVNLNGFMQMTELVLRSNCTADFQIRFLTSDSNLKKHTDVLDTTVAALRAMEVDQTNITYTYDAATKKVTLNYADGTKHEITLTKVAKSETRPYDSVEFRYTLPTAIGATTELVFAAIDGKPAYAPKTMYFKGDIKVMGSIPALTINPDGSGTLKAFMSMEFKHVFNADLSAVVWLGGEGDRIEAPVTKNADGKMVITVNLMGYTIVMTEVDAL